MSDLKSILLLDLSKNIEKRRKINYKGASASKSTEVWRSNIKKTLVHASSFTCALNNEHKRATCGSSIPVTQLVPIYSYFRKSKMR